jgi:hypothetical protein
MISHACLVQMLIIAEAVPETPKRFKVRCLSNYSIYRASASIYSLTEELSGNVL